MSDDLNKAAQNLGFSTHKEMQKMICEVSLSTPEWIAEFKHWQKYDGTKASLLKLMVEGRNKE